MKKADAEVEHALGLLLDKIDGMLRGSGYAGPPVGMFLAGGLAVNFYCGSRHTMDVDAVFSRRLLLDHKSLVIDYVSPVGEPTFLYLDPNFNPDFALLHEDYRDDAVEWEGIGNERRLVQLFVFSPADLAISKLSRFSADDRADIMALALDGLITVETVRARAEEAMVYYVGNTAFLKENLDFACEQIREVEPEKRKPSGPVAV